MKTPEAIALEVIEKMKTFRYQIHTHECDADAAVNLVAQAIRAERERVLPSFDRFEHAFNHSIAISFYDWLRDNMQSEEIDGNDNI